METETKTEDVRDSDMDPWIVKTDYDKSTGNADMEVETTPLIHDNDETVPLLVPASGTPKEKKVVVMEWHTCGICLEEMVDSDLLTHLSCGVLLCSECLESSKQHTIKEDGKMPCPVSEESRSINLFNIQVFLNLFNVQVFLICLMYKVFL